MTVITNERRRETLQEEVFFRVDLKRSGSDVDYWTYFSVVTEILPRELKDFVILITTGLKP